MSEFNAKCVPDFLEVDLCNELLNYAKNTNDWARNQKEDFWDNRTIYHNKLIEVGFDCKKIASKIKLFIEKEYNLEVPVYADSLVLCRWFEKTSQPPHCDDMKNVEDQYEFNKHRAFGALIYINDDYGGGRTYYPDHNFEVIPKSCSLAVHLADCNHKHGVTEILNGTRYTLASFWTFDENKSALELR